MIFLCFNDTFGVDYHDELNFRETQPLESSLVLGRDGYCAAQEQL